MYVIFREILSIFEQTEIFDDYDNTLYYMRIAGGGVCVAGGDAVIQPQA